MKIGNTNINTKALAEMTEEQFLEMFVGKIMDIENEIVKLRPYFKKPVVVEVEEVVEEKPKRRRKKSED